MVYGRSVNQRVLDFVHSGKLWNDSLVLEDRQTGSLWAQPSGRSIRGDLEGNALEPVVSEMTTWGDWKERHPDTLALPWKGRRKLKHVLYPRAPHMLGMLGTENPDPRLPGKTLVAGFAAGDDPDAVAVALPGGGGRRVARLRWGHREIVVEHQGSTGSTRAWLSSGPPDWARNEEIPASTMYWFVWAGLHPDSRIADGEWRQATFPPR